MKKEKCDCCNNSNKEEVIIGEYVCYYNHVTEDDIKDAILKGAKKIR